jgi:hypothetical protein
MVGQVMTVLPKNIFIKTFGSGIAWVPLHPKQFLKIFFHMRKKKFINSFCQGWGMTPAHDSHEGKLYFIYFLELGTIPVRDHEGPG